MKLKDALKEFQEKEGLSLEELYHEFQRLAKVLFYDGYLLVNNDIKIYIHTVEFYYHEENGNIKDPIVYHRNKNDVVVDYFPLGILHQHISGVDITFEKKDKYRASALIRAFDVVDKDNRVIVEKEQRSTFLYDYLPLKDDIFCGASLTVKWEDFSKDIEDALVGALRKNVPIFDKLDEEKKWKFTRSANIRELIG